MVDEIHATYASALLDVADKLSDYATGSEEKQELEELAYRLRGIALAVALGAGLKP